MEDQLPLNEGFADFAKSFSKAVGRPKSKAKVIKAKVDKAREAKKRIEAKLLKETEPQVTRPGATAGDFLRETKSERASTRGACSGTVVTGAVHIAGTVPYDKPVSERVMYDWMDKRGLTKQHAIAGNYGRGIFQSSVFTSRSRDFRSDYDPTA